MLRWLLLLPLLLPCTAEKFTCNFLKPTFISQDLHNNLTWKAPSEGATYSVTFQRYGHDNLDAVPECTNITHTWCDLTKETSDYEDSYYAHVTINSKHCSKITTISDRFCPFKDTKISPPTIKLVDNETFMEIKLSHPMNSSADKPEYEIYLNGKEIAVKRDPYYKIEPLIHDKKYCVTAKVHWNLLESNLSDKTCVTINAAYTSRTTIVLVGVASLIIIILLVIAVVYIIRTYVYVKNIKQPRNLNIGTRNNENIILIEAQAVTINYIKSDGILECTQIMDKEEGKEELRNPHDLHLTDSEKHISLDSGIIESHEESDEGSDDYHGYRSLQEEITPIPIISPYDMPHYPQRTVRPSEATSDIVNEENLYGRIQCNAIPNKSMQGKEDVYLVRNECVSETLLDENSYLPHGTLNADVQDKVKEQPCVLEECCTDQNSDSIHLMPGSTIDEVGMLFVDWCPDNSHLYIPNLSKNKELENCIQQCQEEQERSLRLVEVMGMAEEDELGQMQERWGLCLKGMENEFS